MLKKLGFPTVALAAMLTLFTPSAANAKPHLRFHVGIGVPAYTYPYAYPDRYYAPDYGYGYAPDYPYAYSAPYSYGYGLGLGFGGGRGYRGGQERFEHRGFENHGHTVNRGGQFRGHSRSRR